MIVRWYSCTWGNNRSSVYATFVGDLWQCYPNFQSDEYPSQGRVLRIGRSEIFQSREFLFTRGKILLCPNCLCRGLDRSWEGMIIMIIITLCWLWNYTIVIWIHIQACDDLQKRYKQKGLASVSVQPICCSVIPTKMWMKKQEMNGSSCVQVCWRRLV